MNEYDQTGSTWNPAHHSYPIPPVISVEQGQMFMAEARKFEAEARRLNAEAELFEAQAGIARINFESAKVNDEAQRAQDVFYQSFFFEDEVNAKSVGQCMDRLLLWHRTKPECNIDIVFTSPGGSVIHGFALYDFLGQLRRQGHHITTSTLGMAASMAATLLQAGDVRVMSEESWLLLHQGGLSVEGMAGQVEDALHWNQRMRDRIANVFVTRAAEAAKTNSQVTNPLSLEELTKNWNRADWWVDAREALKLGLIDEIR